MIHECPQNTKKLEVSYDNNGAEVWIEYEGCCANIDIDLSVNYAHSVGLDYQRRNYEDPDNR